MKLEGVSTVVGRRSTLVFGTRAWGTKTGTLALYPYFTEFSHWGALGVLRDQMREHIEHRGLRWLRYQLLRCQRSLRELCKDSRLVKYRLSSFFVDLMNTECRTLPKIFEMYPSPLFWSRVIAALKYGTVLYNKIAPEIPRSWGLERDGFLLSSVLFN